MFTRTTSAIATSTAVTHGVIDAHCTRRTLCPPRTVRVFTLATVILAAGSFYAPPTPAPASDGFSATGPRLVELLRTMPAALSTAPAMAQLTCGWCEEFPTFGDSIIWMHMFSEDDPEGCNWPEPQPVYQGGQVTCAACGGTSTCHSEPDVGLCHHPCGGSNGNGNGNGTGNGTGNGGSDGTGDREGVFDTAYDDLRIGLSEGDEGRTLSVLRAQGMAYRVEYIPDGGRVEMFRPCDPIRPAAVFAVPTRMRPSLVGFLSG